MVFECPKCPFTSPAVKTVQSHCYRKHQINVPKSRLKSTACDLKQNAKTTNYSDTPVNIDSTKQTYTEDDFINLIEKMAKKIISLRQNNASLTFAIQSKDRIVSALDIKSQYLMSLINDIATRDMKFQAVKQLKYYAQKQSLDFNKQR
ncbi:hypothetical protein HDV01_003633 [Terramyces sp. JEL0728]|nr:hypothetical protein HDV01_003633 [Terramyces sp. JEL0728]